MAFNDNIAAMLRQMQGSVSQNPISRKALSYGRAALGLGGGTGVPTDMADQLAAIMGVAQPQTGAPSPGQGQSIGPFAAALGQQQSFQPMQEAGSLQPMNQTPGFFAQSQGRVPQPRFFDESTDVASALRRMADFPGGRPAAAQPTTVAQRFAAQVGQPTPLADADFEQIQAERRAGPGGRQRQIAARDASLAARNAASLAVTPPSTRAQRFDSRVALPNSNARRALLRSDDSNAEFFDRLLAKDRSKVAKDEAAYVAWQRGTPESRARLSAAKINAAARAKARRDKGFEFSRSPEMAARRAAAQQRTAATRATRRGRVQDRALARRGLQRATPQAMMQALMQQDPRAFAQMQTARLGDATTRFGIEQRGQQAQMEALMRQMGLSQQDATARLGIQSRERTAGNQLDAGRLSTQIAEIQAASPGNTVPDIINALANGVALPPAGGEGEVAGGGLFRTPPNLTGRQRVGRSLVEGTFFPAAAAGQLRNAQELARYLGYTQ